VLPSKCTRAYFPSRFVPWQRACRYESRCSQHLCAARPPVKTQRMQPCGGMQAAPPRPPGHRLESRLLCFCDLCLTPWRAARSCAGTAATARRPASPRRRRPCWRARARARRRRRRWPPGACARARAWRACRAWNRCLRPPTLCQYLRARAAPAPELAGGPRRSWHAVAAAARCAQHASGHAQLAAARPLPCPCPACDVAAGEKAGVRREALSAAVGAEVPPALQWSATPHLWQAASAAGSGAETLHGGSGWGAHAGASCEEVGLGFVRANPTQT